MKQLLLLAALLVTSPAYAQVTLGTSSSATNPERSGDATTGLFSGTTGTVSISSAGVEIEHVNGTGVGIGTVTPQTLLTISKNASGVPALSSSVVNLQIVGPDSNGSAIEMDTFGSNNPIYFVRYNGTFSSQTGLLSGDSIGQLVASGYNGSALSTNKAGMIFAAGGNWSTSSNPTFITFATTPVGATAKSERMRIDTTGDVGIGTTSPAGTLDVEGGTAAASTSGTGIILAAQNGGSGNQNGGDIVLTPGTATGTGSVGIVEMRNSSSYIQSAGAIVANGSNTAGGGGSAYGILSSGGPFVGWYGVDFNGYSDNGSTQTVQISSGSTVTYFNGGGNVGIGTTSPQATLDVAGFERLTLNSSAPATCGSGNEGAIALTHLAQVCICDTTPAWHVLNTSTVCSW